MSWVWRGKSWDINKNKESERPFWSPEDANSVLHRSELIFYLRLCLRSLLWGKRAAARRWELIFYHLQRCIFLLNSRSCDLCNGEWRTPILCMMPLVSSQTFPPAFSYASSCSSCWKLILGSVDESSSYQFPVCARWREDTKLSSLLLLRFVTALYFRKRLTRIGWSSNCRLDFAWSVPIILPEAKVSSGRLSLCIAGLELMHS